MTQRDRDGVKEREIEREGDKERARERIGSRVVKREMQEMSGGKNIKMKTEVVGVLPWQ